MNNHVEIIRVLMMSIESQDEQRTYLEREDDLKCRAIHHACKKGSFEALELLLKSGADVYRIDFRGWNAVHYAAYNGHAKLVNKLLKWEADTDALRNMESSQKKLPYNLAKDTPVKKAFNRKNCSLCTFRYLASMQGGRSRHGEDSSEGGSRRQ